MKNRIGELRPSILFGINGLRSDKISLYIYEMEILSTFVFHTIRRALKSIEKEKRIRKPDTFILSSINSQDAFIENIFLKPPGKGKFGL